MHTKMKNDAEWEYMQVHVQQTPHEQPTALRYIKPLNWYMFCTNLASYYTHRNEPVAAMVYWSMRYWDESGPVEDPEWDQATNEYWDYKASWMESFK